jgi:ribosomal protein S18 acetylase RimI-like enzyme
MSSAHSNVTIRDARPTDADAAASIAVEAWRPIYIGYRQALGDEIFARLGDMEAQKREQVRRFITSTPADAIVAEVDGRVVGFGTLLMERKDGAVVGELGNNAVDAKYAGRGIGKMMAEASIAKLKARGATLLKVATGCDDAHAPARRLYEKLGFQRSLQQVTYYMTV